MMPEFEIDFGIQSEINVREAFSQYANEFGYTIQKSGDRFPDYELVDENGTTIAAEAETCSRNFMDHGHDLRKCDLIVCWYDNLPVTPLPTLELGKYISAPTTPKEPPKFISVYDPGKHIKTIEMWNDSEETLYFRFGWYLREDGVIAHKSSKTPFLDQTEFEELFEQIDESVREAAFVDINFDRLIEWHEALPVSEQIRPDRDGRMLASLDQGSEGEKVLKLMNESNINLSRYLENGRAHPDSQNSATIDKNAFLGVLSHIPREVREQVFLDLDLRALWDWHQY